MIGIFSSVIILSGFLHVATNTREEYLWCYECNTNLSQVYKDCNDPYTPGTFDLVACPRNESHHCHKSTISYKNILITVRGCVSSQRVNQYCSYKDSFPHLNTECYSCKENACNDKESLSPIPEWYLGLIAIISSWILT